MAVYVRHVLLLVVNILSLVLHALLFYFEVSRKPIWLMMVMSLNLAIYAMSLQAYAGHAAVKLVNDLENLGYKLDHSAQLGLIFEILGWAAVMFAWCGVEFWTLWLNAITYPNVAGG